ncbi:sigma-54-dependent transcriptional regulator [Clostridium sp. BL-8]|uniref:sigma-54-dependent Fis family transcriptional regulator n=1 Tax=Clostridium sp. BL-8 TaxID=349938 RepID=UPI00098CE115|nr:sigma-54-dependent transcriptional regulator [Clostridium sp. BL-8]OOM78874.1 transcriptional regulatory protein TyrR [Clostridium sp. BL-8]
MKVMAIAPYEGLKELMIDVGKNEEFELQVEVGDLEKGVKLAKEALINNTDVIISRGGTAEMIQKVVSIPVIEIEISGYDMLRVLTLLKDYPGKIAIVGFASISTGAATVCEILDVNISSYTIKDEAEVEPMLIKLKQEGYQAIIGDFITAKKAESLGLNGILLTSGKESVSKAFKNAQKVYEHSIRVNKELSITKKIIDSENNGIIVYDKGLKSVIYSNPFFDEKISKFKNLLNLESLAGKIFENGGYKSVLHIENEYLRITGSLIKDDSILAVCRIEKCGLNHYKDIPGMIIIPTDENQSVNITNMLVTKNEKMKDALTRIEKYLDIEEPIWIIGENGTGKEKLVKYIHFNSSKKDKPLLVADCSIISDENIEALFKADLEGEKSIFDDVGTVFLKNIHKVKIEVQKQLVNCLVKNKFGCRFIVSSDENIVKLTEEGTFQYELYKILSNLTLHLPALSDRKEDIENLTRIYINEFNMQFGKQVVGIREEATEILKNFKWKGNMDQFRQAIRELVLMADEPYIKDEDVEKVLSNMEMSSEKLNIDLTGSLDEIEQRIIKQVWIEEGMNNTRTAERLKITRTTLWRKLK